MPGTRSIFTPSLPVKTDRLISTGWGIPKDATVALQESMVGWIDNGVKKHQDWEMVRLTFHAEGFERCIVFAFLMQGQPIKTFPATCVIVFFCNWNLIQTCPAELQVPKESKGWWVQKIHSFSASSFPIHCASLLLWGVLGGSILCSEGQTTWRCKHVLPWIPWNLENGKKVLSKHQETSRKSWISKTIWQWLILPSLSNCKKSNDFKYCIFHAVHWKS